MSFDPAVSPRAHPVWMAQCPCFLPLVVGPGIGETGIHFEERNPTQSTANQIQPVQFPRCDNMPWPAAASLPTPFLNHRLRISCKMLQVHPLKLIWLVVPSLSQENESLQITSNKLYISKSTHPGRQQGGAEGARQRRSMLRMLKGHFCRHWFHWFQKE